jgi:transposase
MRSFKFISKALRLVGMKVCDVLFNDQAQELHLSVKPYKNGARCPQCERRGKIVRTLPQARGWRDITVCGWAVFLHYFPREIECSTHGRAQERIPWADAYARVTHRLELLVLTYAQLMTQKAAAELVHLPRSSFSDILHRTITRLREGHRIGGLKALGIDEVSYRKGHKYVTVVYDLERSCVVWVGEGKARETIDRFFQEQLSTEQREQIQWACCDMSETFIGAIKEHCPNAELVLDRFHIVKALNEALDEVRKEQWREASGAQRKALKGLRWLLFRHPKKRSEADTELLNELRKSNRRIHRAWVLKDEFTQFWDFTTPDAARVFLEKWCTSALRSRLEPLRKFVHTLREHTDNILTFIDSRLTNAVAEGLNRIIRAVKNRASGFRNVDAFIDLIYLTIGDVDLPAQIPSEFRTI